jgi:hypothetical protein
MIKCVIGMDGIKRYHLPFDQKYKTMNMSKPNREYLSTVKEAELKGYRRAWKFKTS